MNIIIAEYMGMQKTPIGWYDNEEVYPNQLRTDGNTFDVLKFDISWSWLMPVVEKIELNEGWELIMSSNDCYWNKFGDNPNNEEIYFEGCRILAVYNAVVWMINWLNKK